jgi:trans-aconitate 2-methyltransferase
MPILGTRPERRSRALLHVGAVADAWDPDQYERFARERRQPFDDLLALIQPDPGASVLDLGCGNGELTVELHQRVGAADTIGIDTSPAMLGDPPSVDGVRFEVADLTTYEPDRPLGLIAASASLQWTADHDAQLLRLTGLLRPRGQLAVQMPCNADHPSHTLIAEVARERPFVDVIDPEAMVDPVATNVHAPAHYAELLHALGYERQVVRMQVYGHVLASTAEVVEWTRGTTLTRMSRGLPAELYEPFVERYRQRLLEVLGDHRPYFYAFKRILIWGRLP